MRCIYALIILFIIIAQGSQNYNCIGCSISAETILKTIQNNDSITCDNVIINGDLDLNKAQLDNESIERDILDSNLMPKSRKNRVFKYYIKIINSRINGNVNFSNIYFKDSIDFENTTFIEDANFSYSFFEGPSDFTSSKFSRDADFEYSEFSRDAKFRNSMFAGEANFRNSNFAGKSDFMTSYFNNETTFLFSAFNGPAYFSGSEFYNKSKFEFSAFLEPAYFNNCKFYGPTSFEYSTFKSNAFFLDAKFFDELDLKLTGYDKLYLDWDNIIKLKYNEESCDASYQSLIENFKKIGFMKDADNCYYQFRVDQFLKGNSDDKFTSPFNFGAWIFYGFGKKPIYPLLWSIFFIILFGLLWMRMGSKDSKIDFAIMLWVPIFVLAFLYCYLAKDLSPQLWSLSPLVLLVMWSMLLMAFSVILWRLTRSNRSESAIDEHLETQKCPRSVPEALVFSATVFLSGTKLFVDPPAIPIQQNVSGSFAKTMFVMERSLGAFFSILFFLAIGATVARL
jgi:hypothetical protein